MTFFCTKEVKAGCGCLWFVSGRIIMIGLVKNVFVAELYSLPSVSDFLVRNGFVICMGMMWHSVVNRTVYWTVSGV